MAVHDLRRGLRIGVEDRLVDPAVFAVDHPVVLQPVIEAGPGREQVGDEKVVQVRRLRQQFPEARTVAYGNSMPDVPHLDVVDQGWCINASGKLRAECERRRINIVDWQ